MSTQIRGNKQIKNITIENEQLVNGTIELNKLKEGSELIKRDGSVTFTGNVDAGSNKLVNVAAGVNATDAVNKAQLDAVEDKVGGTLITREIVSGTKDGENVTFTLAEEPTLATEQIFFNGALLNAGVNADYTISGNVITFAVAPQPGDSILANYVVDAIQLNVDVQATINQINGRVGLVEADMAAAESDIAALESADAAMDVRVTANEADIASLETRATNLETNVDAVEADIAAEESRAMAAESALDVRVSANEVEILGLKTRMTAAEGDIDDLEAADVAMDSRVSNLEDGLQAETTARTNAVSSLNTRVTALEAEDGVVDGRLDTLESDVSTLETDLASESATRLANDNTLQSNINSEIAARTAAVSAVQANLNTEIGDRFAADMAEEAARIAAVAVVEDGLANEIIRAEAAEGVLSGRLDEIEAVSLPELFSRMDVVESNTDQNTIDIGIEMNRAMAAESDLSDRIDVLEADPVSQAYVDQKIADLVNSAPAVLDTLKELSDALGGDENFATTIATDIAAVDVRVDTVVADLAQEALDRADDVDAEEARAMAAEAALDVRVTAVETNKVEVSTYDTKMAAIDSKNAAQDTRLTNLESDPVTKTYVDGEVSSLDSRIDALESAPPPVSSLDSLSDVSVTSPSNGQVIQYNGTEWVNGPAPSTFSGSYNDLTDKPSIPSLTQVESDISSLDSRVTAVEGDVTLKANSADLATVATSGSYNDLLNKPSLFSGSYSDLSDKPSLFSGSYTDLTDKPSLFDGAYSSLTGAPNLATVATSGSYTDLTDKPSLFSGSYTDLTDKPSLFDGNYSSLSGAPVLSTVATSGSYVDLSDKPSIPSITGLATESYVDTAVAGVVNSAPAVLDTLNELAAALGNDENFATTVAGQIGDVASDVSELDTRVTATEGDITTLQSDVALKVNASSLATVATSGSYVDLTNKPSLFSGSYSDLSDKPSLFSGSYTDLTNKPSLATVATSGSYVDLTNKPTIYTPVKQTFTSLVDGTETEFVLTSAPAVAGTEQVFLNGILQSPGVSDDYTISGSTITFNTAPDAGWKLVVYYFV